MKKVFYLMTMVALLAIVIFACNKTPTVDEGKPNSEYISAAVCTGVTPTYTADIKAIFDARCATSGCHISPGAAHGLDLSTYALAKRDFNVHALLCSINQDASCSKMPTTGAKLAAADITKITCWAKNGFAQ